MTESTTVGTRFHTSSAALGGTTNNTCPSNYPDYCSNCGTKPQSKQPTEAEVNRKVMEILRRMTSQQVDENDSKDMNRTHRSVKRPLATSTTDASLNSREQIKSARWDTCAPNSADGNRILIKPLAPQLSAGSFSLPVSTTTVATSYPASSPQLLITTSTVKPTIPLLPRDDKLSHQQQSSSVSAVLGRRCSCSRSCCLKLYCECFAAGVFCTDCSCISCYNLAEHEEFRRKAIMRIVTRKPDAFQSKIAHSAANTSVHTRGCNCKRSGCLKNYCECYEARIRCSSRCRCQYCYNVDGENHTTLNPNAPRVTSQSSLQCVTHSTLCVGEEEKTPTDSPAESSGSPCSATGGGRLTPKPYVLRAVGDSLQPVSPAVSVCPSEENRKTLALDVSVHSPDASNCSVRSSLSKEQLSLELPAVNGANACATERTTAPIMPCVSRSNSPTTTTAIAEHPTLKTGVIKSTPIACDPGPVNETTISVPPAATTSNLLATWLALMSSVAPSPPLATVPLGAETLVLFNSPIIPTLPQLPTSTSVNLCPPVTSAYGACNNLSDSPASTPPAATAEAQYTAEELATFDRILRQRKLQEQRSEFDQISNADHTSQCNSDGKKSDPDAPQGCAVLKMDPDPSPPPQTAVTPHEVSITLKPEPCVPSVASDVLVSIPKTGSKSTQSRIQRLSTQVCRLYRQVQHLTRIVHNQGRVIRELRRSTMRRSYRSRSGEPCIFIEND
ncbi:hypothetical protein PHET_03875 [Paragonimus heterotremus]|uniref:CRC domain-containing protein n=1 Tax=Paragonimus heterotremus TaxID=100268 RepID=A0A8J4TJ25_9TREM|nr:hypothetical protein PHET_03875 [Paragonimus heterotremus]